MTETWKDEMHAAIATWLREKHKVDAVTVTDLYEITAPQWGCETCGNDGDIIEVEIAYVDSNDKAGYYDYYGSLADLIRNIT